MQKVEIKTVYLIENHKEFMECQKHLFEKDYEWWSSGKKHRTPNIQYDFPLFIYLDYNSKLTYSDAEYFYNHKQSSTIEIINWKKFNRSLKLKRIK